MSPPRPPALAWHDDCVAQCVNPAGAVTGYYFDQNGAIHGYVRNPDGTIATFDAPGAGTGSARGLTPGPSTRRDNRGASQDNNGVYHACCARPTQDHSI